MSWLVFDIDGVLIDVSQSFDHTVKDTVTYLLNDQGLEISLKDIRKLRKKGVFGDDFKLTETLVAGLSIFDSSEEVLENFLEEGDIQWVRKEWSDGIDKSKLIKVFNSFYLGQRYEEGIFNFEGYWKKEKSIVRPKMLKKAEKNFEIGVVTGRNRLELNLAQDIIGYKFDNHITREIFLKPDPRALNELVGMANGVYVGDTICDQELVENYNSTYEGDFNFVKIDGEINTVNTFLEKILRKKRI